MITQVYIALDIEKLKNISDRDLKDYMKMRMVEIIDKEIEEANIHIDIDEYRSKSGLIFAYTTFELNLNIEKNIK